MWVIKWVSGGGSECVSKWIVLFEKNKRTIVFLHFLFIGRTTQISFFYRVQKPNFLLLQLKQLVKPCIHKHVAYTLHHSRVALHHSRVAHNRQTVRTPDVWKGHPAHPVLFVFAQKTDKFWFTANGMWAVRGWRSAGLQSHPHIRVLGSRTVHEPFGALVYTRLYMLYVTGIILII